MLDIHLSCSCINSDGKLHCGSCHSDEEDGYYLSGELYFEETSNKGLHNIIISYCCKFPIEKVTRDQVAKAIRKLYR